MALKVRGARTRAIIMGGRRSVGGRMERRNDLSVDQSFPIHYAARKAYGKFARAPEALNDAQVVYRHCREQERGRVGITYLYFES